MSMAWNPSGEPGKALCPYPLLWEWSLRIAIVAGLALVTVATVGGQVFQPLWHAAQADQWSHFIVRPSIFWALMGLVLLAFRTLLWFRYHGFMPADVASAPSLTVIIPAYNEGAMVQNAIDSVASADYDQDRLEIFVVDDGSRDDTWSHIQAAAKRHPGLVTTLRFERNRGKRAALEAGFRRARGEVVVTIDSDSVIDRGTLLAIAGPFRDPRVGAVAGRVSVFNCTQGVIPRMLQVRYTLSFDFLRAAQSGYGTVYCCPGALAAYRVSVVLEVLDAWMGQRFWGRACTYGEDRSMTNYILARGFDTVYQRSAVVHTVVPITYARLCKMYLRWDRSYVREELRFFRIVWRRPPLKRWIALFDITVTNLRFPVGYASLVLLVWLSIHQPATIVRLLFAIGLMAFFNMLYYLRSERSWDFVFGIFYAYYSLFALCWVFPYAVLTLRSPAWMTR